jgi:hypothetical protein
VRNPEVIQLANEIEEILKKLNYEIARCDWNGYEVDSDYRMDAEQDIERLEYAIRAIENNDDSNSDTNATDYYTPLTACELKQGQRNAVSV